jgi:hypothetical protein
MARSNDSYRLGYGASNYNPDRGGTGGVSFGGTGGGTYGVRMPLEGGGRFGVGLGSGAVGGRGGVAGATLSLPMQYKKKAKGGSVKKMAKGGSASKRADGCATKGKTKGKFV